VLASAGLLLSGAAGAGAARPVSSRESADEDAAAPSQEGPPPLRWNRLYGDRQRTRARSVFEHDGQYVTFGQVSSEESVTQVPWLFGVDATSGEGRWSEPLDGLVSAESSVQRQYTAATLAGSDVVITGAGFGGGDEPVPLELVRVSTDGEVQWQQEYDASEGTSFVPIGGAAGALAAVEDGLLVPGNEFSQDNQSVSGIVLKTGSDGTEQWRTEPFPERLSLVSSLSETDDGTYVGTAWTGEQPDTGTPEPNTPLLSGLFELDSDGSVQWTSEFRAETGGEPNQQSQTLDFVPTDDGYLVVGTTVVGSQSGGGQPEQSGWVVTTDAEGAVQNQRTLSEPLQVTSVTAGGDSYYAAGTTGQQFRNEESSAWLAALDGSGATTWSETASRRTFDQFTDVIATGDGGIVVAGDTTGDGRDASTRAWLAKLGGDEAPMVTDAPTATPTPTPTATETPMRTEAATVSPTPSPTPTPESMTTAPPTNEGGEGDSETDADGATSGSGPGFGVAGTLAALGAGGLLRRLRSDDGK